MSARHVLVALAVACVAAVRATPAQAEPPPPRFVPAPDVHYAPTEPSMAPGYAWLLGTLAPSPAIAFGDASKPSFGLAWQVTPVLWSFGVHRATSPWRFFVVDPIARVSGSIELFGTYELYFGAVDTSLVRGGLRTTLPLIQRGEYLAASFGTSLYDRGGEARLAWDAGLWTFAGFLGATATVAPADDRMRAVATLHLRVMH